MPDGLNVRLRRCLLSGQRTTPDRLLRFAIDPAGAVVPDPAHRLPGRGLWLAPAPGAVAAAGAKGMFARGAKRKVRVPDDLAARATQAWMAHGAGQVAKARRAGLVLADAAVAADSEVLVAEAEGLGLGRLALRRTPFTGRLAADLALLARLVLAGDGRELTGRGGGAKRQGAP